MDRYDVLIHPQPMLSANGRWVKYEDYKNELKDKKWENSAERHSLLLEIKQLKDYIDKAHFVIGEGFR